MKRLTGIMSLIVAAPVLGAGCGGGDRAAATPVDTTRIGMPPHYRFDPAVIRVAAGATVTWTNTDDFTHAVRVDTAGANTHTVPPGDSLRLSFPRPGEYPYVCPLHPHDMRGRVIVATP